MKHAPKTKTASKGDEINPDVLELGVFMPYLVRVFYADVTAAISNVYQSESDLTPAEWRTMVILGLDNSLTANEIVERSSMDKVTVSRAVKGLNEQKLIKIHQNQSDGRSKLLSLNKKGAGLYRKLVPKVLDAERKLLTGISDTQLKQWLHTMNKIRENIKNHDL